MPIRVHGGVFDQQILTGSLAHYVVCGADFSGAIDSYGQPVPGSAAEIIFKNIEDGATINIMNPNHYNLSFALEAGRSVWDEISLTAMVQSLGPDVGVDHVDCAVCTVKHVPYIWGCGTDADSFLDLTDTPKTYAGAANYVVTVNSSETGLIFTPVGIVSNAFGFVAVPTQSTIAATGSATLNLVAGANITLTTNALTNTVTFDVPDDDIDYIPVPSGTTLTFSNRYFVTGPFPVLPNPLAFVTLPLGTGSGKPAGTSVIVTKPADATGVISLLINTQGSDIIATDLGNTNSVEFDATQEVIMIFDGTSTWNLQIGSVNI
jgi:hypothetical protein